LAQKTMDCLWEIYMHANSPFVTEGRVYEASDDAQTWARDTFVELCSEFETPSKKWKIHF
jgi:hypothetical protein